MALFTQFVRFARLISTIVAEARAARLEAMRRYPGLVGQE